MAGALFAEPLFQNRAPAALSISNFSLSRLNCCEPRNLRNVRFQFFLCSELPELRLMVVMNRITLLAGKENCNLCWEPQELVALSQIYPRHRLGCITARSIQWVRRERHHDGLHPARRCGGKFEGRGARRRHWSAD